MNNRKRNGISFYLKTKEDIQKIKNKAKEKNMTISKYLKSLVIRDDVELSDSEKYLLAIEDIEKDLKSGMKKKDIIKKYNISYYILSMILKEE